MTKINPNKEVTVTLTYGELSAARACIFTLNKVINVRNGNQGPFIESFVDKAGALLRAEGTEMDVEQEKTK